MLCESCKQWFPDSKALRWHLESPYAWDHPSCKRCNKRYSSEESRRIHVANSRYHHVCGQCPQAWDFATAYELSYHVATTHQKAWPKLEARRPEVLVKETKILVEKDHKVKDKDKDKDKDKKKDKKPKRHDPEVGYTPIDLFFKSYKSFRPNYDPEYPIAVSYRLLEAHHGWTRGHPDADKAWGRYQAALKDEVRAWFGHDDELLEWQRLCLATRQKKIYPSIRRCEEHLEKVHVNIIDLLDYYRSDSPSSRLPTFASVKELNEYTISSGKFFNASPDKREKNIVLRHMLRPLSSGKKY